MGTGVGELALLQAMGVGAATGAATSALTGGDPLKGALFGALGGGATSALGSALGSSAASTAGAAPGATAGATSAVPSALNTALDAAAATGAPAAGSVPLGSFGDVGMMTQGFGNTIGTAAAPTSVAGMPSPLTNAAAGAAPAGAAAPQTGFMDVFKSTPGGPDFGQRVSDYIATNPNQAAMGGGAMANAFLHKPEDYMPGGEKYSGPLSRFVYDPEKYRPAYAAGGIADLPVSKKYAGGGHLGGYSDGGRLLKGPGDGMSDSIPAKIGQRQPARLADGEFVVPADVVSHLGNGSTDAGAKQLYAMMDKVRRARTGNKKQGREINPRKYVPA